MRRFIFAVAALALVASGANAQSIIGYNVTNARPNGGGWTHTYTGAISAPVGGLSNYTGGGGTMNDGVVSNTASDNQLFKLADNSVITLFLSGTFQLSSLTLFGGANVANIYPGALQGATIGFGGGSATLLSTAINNNGCFFMGFCDDVFNFAGTSLAGLSGNTITLSNFQSSQDGFNITEITVAGVPLTPVTTVPEPSAFVLVGFGLAAMVLVGRRVRA